MIAKSRTKQQDSGYPGVMFIPPVEQYMESYSVSLVTPPPIIPGSISASTWVSLVALKTETLNVRLNGENCDTFLDFLLVFFFVKTMYYGRQS